LFSIGPNEFNPGEIGLYNRWLYTPRADGKPRVLIIRNATLYEHSWHFIHGNIKQVQFLISINLHSKKSKNIKKEIFPVAIFNGKNSVRLFHPPVGVAARHS
jgi:hypothetical protein